MPEDIATFARSVMKDNAREHVVALYLSGAHEIVAYSLVSIGTANTAHVSPREIFQQAILAGAVSVALAHNHPSGSTTPSEQDVQITRQLSEAGQLLGIKLLDHVIVTDESFLSLHELGRLS